LDLERKKDLKFHPSNLKDPDDGLAMETETTQIPNTIITYEN